MPDLSTLLGSLNIIDYAVIAALVLSGIMATTRGLMREMLGIMGWVLAVMVATIAKPLLAEKTEDLINHEQTAAIIGFIAPFAFTALVFYLLANLVSPGLRSITFGGFDTILGFFFGIARGMVLAVLVYLAAILAYDGEANLPGAVRDSVSINITRSMARIFAGFASGDLRFDIDDALPDATPRPQGNLLHDEKIAAPDLLQPQAEQ